MSSHHHLILFHLNVLNHHISSLHFFSAHSSSVTSLFFPSICSLPPTCFRATLSSSFCSGRIICTYNYTHLRTFLDSFTSVEPERPLEVTELAAWRRSDANGFLRRNCDRWSPSILCGGRSDLHTQLLSCSLPSSWWHMVPKDCREFLRLRIKHNKNIQKRMIRCQGRLRDVKTKCTL